MLNRCLPRNNFVRSCRARRASAPRQGQGRNRLAHRLRLYLALHEGADALDGRSRFRKDPRPDLPGVWHPRPYFELDLTSGGAHPLRHAHGIIEEDLVAADLDERRRQSARVGVKRRRIRRARIGAGEIIAREPRASEPRSIGSASAFRCKEPPVSARSVQGESATAAAGRRTPSSRSLSSIAKTSPPPEDSPSTAILRGSAPSATSAR